MDDPDSLSHIVLILPYLSAIVFLLLLSALISGSEIAFFSLTPYHLNELEKENKGKVIQQLLQKPKKLLATILVANNFINIAIVILSTYTTAYLLKNIEGWWKFVIEVILVTFLILLFGEILPKVYANRNPVRFARFMATPLLVLQKIFYPVSVFLIASTRFVEKKLKKETTNISREDLSQMIELANIQDTTQEEKDLWEGIMSFGETEARQIMRPRIDVFALEDDMSFQEVLNEVSKSGFSRIPVFHENMDNIIGVLFAKDLLPYLNTPNYDWLQLLREPFFVPENMKLDDLLKDFQEKKTHLAVVVDEYGGTSGIITLEDVIEEIVGEITDEYDHEEHNFTRINANTYEFDGKISLKDFYKIMDLVEKEEEIFEYKKGDAESLAGFFLEQSGSFPHKNQQIKIGRFNLTATDIDGKRIKKIKVERLK
jgi:gliding motility-associated protein GldE